MTVTPESLREHADWFEARSKLGPSKLAPLLNLHADELEQQLNNDAEARRLHETYTFVSGAVTFGWDKLTDELKEGWRAVARESKCWK